MSRTLCRISQATQSIQRVHKLSIPILNRHLPNVDTVQATSQSILNLNLVARRQSHGDNRLTGTAPSATGFNDYETEKKTFKFNLPEFYNFATDVIDKWAREEKVSGFRQGLPAFWWIDDHGHELKWSFQQLSELSKKTANVLGGACGLRRGDRVIVILPRLPQWWLINIAAIRAGLILIPGTTQLTTRDIKHRLQTSNATALIGDHSVVDRVEQVAKECPDLKIKISVSEFGQNTSIPGWLNFDELLNNASNSHTAVQTRLDEPMTLFFTSGTTGSPKMTEHTHGSYGLAHVITGRYWMDLTPTDVHWSQADTGWAKCAWSNLFAPWLMGACIFIHHAPKFDSQRVLQVLQQFPISTFCTAPTGYRVMVQDDLSNVRFPALRHCLSAGEPLNPEVIETWLDQTNQLIREGYGQTETVLTCGTYRCIPNRPGSMGKPPPGMDSVVIDQDNNETAPGEEGDIAIRVKPARPLGLFSQYCGEPERTAAAYRGDFYITGDRAYRDEDGYYWFVSRNDDVILSSGYRIGPFEVESALIEHPAVMESAVVSSPDPTRGEVVKAFIVRTQAYKDHDKVALSSEIQQHVKHITAPYKYPRKIEFVETLPKTVSGKIRRIELRNKEWDRS